MNAAFPLAVYAAVSKHLGRPLEFPADIASWQMYQSMSSSMMNAYVGLSLSVFVFHTLQVLHVLLFIVLSNHKSAYHTRPFSLQEP
jgi:uncharacterized membrane protein